MLDEGIRQLRINSIDRVPTLVRGASGRESVKAATVKELLLGNEDHDEEDAKKAKEEKWFNLSSKQLVAANVEGAANAASATTTHEAI